MFSNLKEHATHTLRSLGFISEAEDIAHMQHSDIFSLASIIITLHAKNLLTSDNWIKILGSQANLQPFHIAFNKLSLSGILTQKNIDHVFDFEDLDSLVRLIKLMSRAKLLNSINWELIQTALDFHAVAEAIRCLHRTGVLTQSYFMLVVRHPFPLFYAEALYDLNQAGILSEYNHAHLIVTSNIRTLCYAIHDLYLANILTQNHFNLMINQPYPQVMADCLQFLKVSSLLLSDTSHQIERHSHPMEVAKIIKHLFNLDLLNPFYFNFVIHHDNLVLMNYILDQYALKGKLNPSNLEFIIHHPDKALTEILRGIDKDTRPLPIRASIDDTPRIQKDELQKLKFFSSISFLSDRRFQSPIDQLEYDKCYGLTLYQKSHTSP